MSVWWVDLTGRGGYQCVSVVKTYELLPTDRTILAGGECHSCLRSSYFYVPGAHQTGKCLIEFFFSSANFNILTSQTHNVN